ncbi:14634_t:CDS:1, partial [Dentiscutata erythropus]
QIMVWIEECVLSVGVSGFKVEKRGLCICFSLLEREDSRDKSSIVE